jgi:tripartite-type tricarboxylate transporter receptor subunit TctC
MGTSRWRRVFALLVALAPATTSTQAQTVASAWPQRTVRLVVPLPPGSGTDIAARVLAERLAERWSQPVVVENRQGADGIPAVTAVLSARDTHMLLLSFAGIITINPLIHDQLPYDPVQDLVPIAPVADNFIGVSATAALRVETLTDLVKAARARPGELNWAATPGLPYYIVLALERSAAIDMVPVGYRDFAPALQDLSQGRLHVAATGVPILVPHHRAGTAKLLFVSNRERAPQAPEVPTAKEAGYPDLAFEGTVGIYGWRNMPVAMLERISAEVRAVTAEAAFAARLSASGTAARSGSAAEFAAAIEQQRAKIAAIHRATAKPRP